MKPSAQPTPPQDRPAVLVVDDNRVYREAFRRNLLLEGYAVVEAEDAEEAMARLREQAAQVLVTDLAMRHPTEGLDLIRQARALNPCLPIIMISAVGTFEEGAEASRLGACHVLSKSKIEAEMDCLYRAIDQAYAQYRRDAALAEQLAQARVHAEKDREAAQAEIRRVILDREASAAIKSEAFDLLSELDAPTQAEASRQDLARARGAATADAELFARADAGLRQALGDLEAMDHQTVEALRTAEFLYLYAESDMRLVDFSRSIGFSYCFAVENEAKARLRKRLQKFFADAATPRLVKSLLEDNGRALSIFYHQYLLRLLRDANVDVTMDNVYQVFQRVLEHGGKYKPDGLKALGIVILCFGRVYAFRKLGQEIKIDNPLGIRGETTGSDALRLATLLTNLQHYRNPYIHPEISEMEKLSKIRASAIECLSLSSRLA
jgi:CheY-like chemotaxis protein